MSWLRSNLFDKIQHKNWPTSKTIFGIVNRDMDGDIVDEIWFESEKLAKDGLAVLWANQKYEFSLETRYFYTSFSVVKEIRKD